MMNAATSGLGGALDLRPKDASLGPLGPSPAGERPSSPGAKSVFEDRLQESLASPRNKKKDDEPANVDAGPATQPTPPADAKPAERKDKSQGRDGDEDAPPSASSADRPSADCAAAAAAADAAASTVATSEVAGLDAILGGDDSGEAVSLEAETASIPADAVSPETSAAPTKKGISPQFANANTQTIDQNVPVEATTSKEAPEGVPVDAQEIQESVNLGEMEAISATPSNVASATASDADLQSDAATANATEQVFDRLTDDNGDESSEKEKSASTGVRQAERSESSETFKAPVASTTDPQPQVTETRSPGLSGLGAASLPRLAEFEAARAGLAAESYANVPHTDTPDRIVHSLRMQFQRGGGDAVVQIKPEHLGPLTISLRVENGSVSAHVTADNPVTAEWLQANEQTLRDGLKSSGLQLDRLVVNRDPDPTGRSPQREESQAQREQRRRFDGRKSTFEVTV